ncbi:putative serine/threonine-protein kinase WNK6 isoform X2 [Carex rostrata]
MGKNGGSKAGSDTDPEGVVEIDPTQRDILGKGAYKKVYKAFDQIDGIEVAWNKVSIEQMLQSPENLSRLYSEVHFLKTLRHQNILRFHTSWVDDENRHINIITELFISGSLRSYRKMHQRVDLKAIKNWARQILRGLVFLHSHKPPIIHRDLKCDNIFINGNSGEVKIGDLGLATMMLQAKARSVLGTPEFMAPELYDEEYNELVDIYSFGMCMLEMVTLEYPYSECHNAAQIFKRVSSGVKPAALEKVTNLQLRYFIEQCLFPASERKSAKELLEDPFLQCSTSQETNPFLQCSTSQEINPSNTVTSFQPPQSHRSTSAEKILLDIEAVSNRSNPTSDVGVEANYIEPVAISNGGVESNSAETGPPVLEFVRVNRDIEFRLEGGTIDENSVSLFMRITDSNDHVRNVHFTFYLDSDTSLGVAGEMVEQLELGDYHVPFLSEFIDYLLVCLVPDWRPLTDGSANGDNTSTVGNGSTLENEFTLENELNRSDGLPDTNRLSLNSTLINALRAVCEEEVKSASDGSSTSVKPDSGGSPKSNSGGHTRIENSNCETGESSAPPDRCHIAAEAVGKKPLNGCTLQCLDEDDEGLQSEIYDIREHYRHLFEELNRMQEVALTNARKRWMRKLDKSST